MLSLSIVVGLILPRSMETPIIKPNTSSYTKNPVKDILVILSLTGFLLFLALGSIL